MVAVRRNWKTKDMISLVDYCISFTVEKKKDNGEDSEKHSINRSAALFGVFDGCGGAGSQSCPKFLGKTEAYIASRVVADAFQDWFEQSDANLGWEDKQLKELVLSYLRESSDLVGEKSMLVGGIKKKFPTTAAAGICYPGEKTIEVNLYWTGDSRVYLLNSQGLAQLTEDDLGGIDAMENLTDDGVLTNMINLSKDFSIHSGHISMDRPGIIFAATDGCFGYFSTPMEFKYMLLETLLGSDCISSDHSGADESWLDLFADRIQTGWQERLCEVIGEIAGDDFSLSGYSIGFGGFSEMKKAFIPRANAVYSQFISGLSEKSYEEKYALWQKYKGNYYRMICRP